MASTLDYIEFVCSQISEAGTIRTKKMFGDWLIYIDDKPAVLLCDNTCYIKIFPEITKMMKDAQIGCPYPGAKKHYILDIEHKREALVIIKTILPLIKNKS